MIQLHTTNEKDLDIEHSVVDNRHHNICRGHHSHNGMVAELILIYIHVINANHSKVCQFFPMCDKRG